MKKDTIPVYDIPELQQLHQHLLTHSHFSKKEVAVVLACFEEQTFKKKAMIIEAGDRETFQYFIVKGCVRGYIIDYQGKEHNIIFGFENFWFGDIESFDHRTSATLNFEALEPVKALAISKEKWDMLTEEVPSYTAYKANLFRNSMISQQRRMAEHFMYTAEQRYLDLVATHPEFLQRISLKNIASYLGISPEFVSMLRKKTLQH